MKQVKQATFWLFFLGFGIVGFAAACAPQNSPEPTLTAPIPGPALVQFFTDP
jgi:hypothetical protein